MVLRYNDGGGGVASNCNQMVCEVGLLIPPAWILSGSSCVGPLLLPDTGDGCWHLCNGEGLFRQGCWHLCNGEGLFRQGRWHLCNGEGLFHQGRWHLCNGEGLFRQGRH